MTRRKYSDEFKEQIVRECQETGNVALVARRNEVSANTIHSWLKNYRQRGTVKAYLKVKLPALRLWKSN
jgi:transposase